MMKVEEAFPYESMMKRGNQKQGRGVTTIKVDHIYSERSGCLIDSELRLGVEWSGELIVFKK